MAVYLDIDADFMFMPRTNGSARHVQQDLWLSPKDFMNAMKEAGLRWDSSSLNLLTDHREAYFVWIGEAVSSDTLIHVDAHSDLYDSFSWMVHCGNFLRKAVERGKFSKVIWAMPSWLYESNQWREYDLPGFSPRGKSSFVYYESEPFSPSPLVKSKVKIEVVPLDKLRLPVTRVKSVTLATSPLFTPESGYTVIQELSISMARECRDFTVRPHIPLCFEDPLLSRSIENSLGYLWCEHRRTMEIVKEKREIGTLLGDNKPRVQERNFDLR